MFLSVLCFFLAICFAIFANQNWFRYFSLGEIRFFVGLTILGLATAKSKFTVFGPHSETVGIQESSMIYSWQIWLIMQALVLLWNILSSKITDLRVIMQIETQKTLHLYPRYDQGFAQISYFSNNLR